MEKMLSHLTTAKSKNKRVNQKTNQIAYSVHYFVGLPGIIFQLASIVRPTRYN